MMPVYQRGFARAREQSIRHQIACRRVTDEVVRMGLRYRVGRNLVEFGGRLMRTPIEVPARGEPRRAA